MKKTLILIAALMLVSMSAFALPIDGPDTVDNYESCDISVAPAATLLLPYFEVDPSGAGENTLVTITNVSDTAIVAHCTVWTNWSFPVLDFNIFLTGYDVASMSLRDVLVSGTLPTTGTTNTLSPRGLRSAAFNTGTGAVLANFFNTAGDATAVANSCFGNQGGAGAIPGFLLTAIQSGLTGGPYSISGAADCSQVGDISDNMIGYITIDVSAVCSQSLPVDADYFDTEIRFTNQLIGDYIRLNDTDGFAGANPLVHIKAIPGSAAAGTVTTNFAHGLGFQTFYNRYQAALSPDRDRRQPLPALFAGRYIAGGTALDTDFMIWREGVTDEVETMNCDAPGLGPEDNAAFAYVELVRFDERENPTTSDTGCKVSPCPGDAGLSETQLININNTSIVPGSSGTSDVGGWVYFNLTIPELDPLGWLRPSQNWVQVRLTGAGLYAGDFDAAYLGNGCTGFVDVTDEGFQPSKAASDLTNKIGPKYRKDGTDWLP
jgi:hypothetical protein